MRDGLIVDVHTHAWDSRAHIQDSFVQDLRLAHPGMEIDIEVTFDAYMKAMEPCERVICFGLRGLKSGLAVPNQYIAAFVQRAPEKLIGFMSLDPNEPDWKDDFERSYQEFHLRGVKLGPLYAGFDPTDTKMDWLYARCVRHNLPVLFHMGTSFVRFGPLAWSKPLLIDAVASRFPDLRIVIAHLGHPWEGDAIAVIRKHPHVYADVSALFGRPWQFYNSMVLAQEYGVFHKLLFGSDYPFTTPAASLQGLRTINRFSTGSNLPHVNNQAVEEIIHRDTVGLLWGEAG
jgi:predicted TIM-barrel fold metal-dependent hydrolase